MKFTAHVVTSVRFKSSYMVSYERMGVQRKYFMQFRSVRFLPMKRVRRQTHFTSLHCHLRGAMDTSRALFPIEFSGALYFAFCLNSDSIGHDVMPSRLKIKLINHALSYYHVASNDTRISTSATFTSPERSIIHCIRHR